MPLDNQNEQSVDYFTYIHRCLYNYCTFSKAFERIYIYPKFSKIRNTVNFFVDRVLRSKANKKPRTFGTSEISESGVFQGSDRSFDYEWIGPLL